MTTTYDTYLPEVLPYAPNCSELVAINAIRNSVIEFCTESWYWQHDCYPQPGVVDVAEYSPDVPDHTKLVGIIDVWYGGKPLYPQTKASIRRTYAASDYRLAVGSPRYWYSQEPDNIILVPMPDTNSAGDEITIQCAIAPLRSSTGAATSIYERYAEVVAMGALARLKATPDQPYSDAAGALTMGRLFKSKLIELRAFVERNKTRGPIRVRFNGRNG